MSADPGREFHVDRHIGGEGETRDADGARRRPNVRPWAIAGAVIVVAGFVVALVSGGGGGASNGASNSDTRPIVEVNGANAQNTINIFRSGVREENLSNFDELFRGDFSERVDLPTCSGAPQPLGATAAVAEWQCIFKRAAKLQLTLTNQSYDDSTKNVTAGYVLTSGRRALAAGRISLHLIPGADYPRIDNVVYSGGRGSFRP